MKKHILRGVALLLALCFLSAPALAEQPVQIEDFITLIPETEAETCFYGAQMGVAYQNFQFGSPSCPVDILVLLPRFMLQAGLEEGGLTLTLQYYCDAETPNVITNFKTEEISWDWNVEELSPQHWVDYCHEQQSRLDSVVMHAAALEANYVLYRIHTQDVRVYENATSITFDLLFSMGGKVARMKDFPLVHTAGQQDGQASVAAYADPEQVQDNENIFAQDASGYDAQLPAEGDTDQLVLSSADPTETVGEISGDMYTDPGAFTEVTPEPTPEPTVVPVANLRSQQLRHLKVYLTCLGYLPPEYWAYNELDAEGNEVYDEVTINAVKAFQAAQSNLESVNGIADRALLDMAEKQLNSNDATVSGYDKTAVDEEVCRQLVALGYLAPEAMFNLQDFEMLSSAVAHFRSDYNLDPNGFVDAELLYALRTAQPTVTPTVQPSATPVPLQLTSDPAPIALKEAQDIVLNGTAPADTTLQVCCKNAYGEQFVIGTITADAEGTWEYTLTSAVLNRYFEDQGNMDVFLMPVDRMQTLRQSIEYNASPAATLARYDVLRHGNELTIIGYTKPHVALEANNQITKSDRNGYFELALSELPANNQVQFYIDSDYQHPQMLDTSNTRAKALFRFLQPIPEVVELLLIILLLIAVFTIVFLKQKKAAPIKERKVKNDVSGVRSVKVKGGSKHV